MSRKNQLTTSDHLEYSEYEKLLEGLHNDKEYIWELYARLGFCTACRASDILTFRWCDILNKSKHIVNEKKTKKTRQISFNPSVQKKIKELYGLLGKPDVNEYVFISSVTSESITIQYINQKLKKFKLKYRINIGHFSTHTFRKTFGRYVYDKHDHSAESLMLLNKILCHSSIGVTKTYIGITQDEINDIFNSIAF
jgi:integrase